MGRLRATTKTTDGRGGLWAMQGAAVAVVLAAVALLMPAKADAFCGTYVSGGEADLFNNATQVVMMREGKQTVLSMQNNYEGPPQDFAMIVPTPVVLQKENVKTLDEKIFNKIDRLTAPRLVEYWEKDPCEPGYQYDSGARAGAGGGQPESTDDGNVKVEAEFTVGEYDIVVLSSDKSAALTNWLKSNNYNIPNGAEPYLDPYIMQGSKFFVAKVNTKKVKFDKNGQAVLSPLRFHYESDQFKLPVRLGLINSKGQQDLIINILAKDQRYEVANYPNATIPTNIEVVNDVRNRFSKFYRALFRETLKKKAKNGQKPVVTEYSWNAATCDPCPGPALDGSDFMTLGADVISGQNSGGGRGFRSGWVITRLHARYGKDEIGKDLVFRKASPIVGGRERYDDQGNLERGASQGNVNNFQGRYIIRHRWDKPVLCDNPEYGRWGGPPGDQHSGPSTMSAPGPLNADGDSEGGGGGGAGTGDGGNGSGDTKQPPIEEDVKEDIPEIGVKANPNGGADPERACSQVSPLQRTVPLALLMMVGGVVMIRRRRRD